AIADGAHMDVLEMDGASQTRVDDIRDNVLSSVQYAPNSARFKVYIIDEVHMLSTSAFNALLKTLEEPPSHVKFIFATTEIRKVPVTVLSRCQRFDLRRIEPEVMIAHLAKIAKSEGVDVAEDALALITRAAEGSARDALSLLDQAIAHGAGAPSADQVRTMIGLADRGRILDLFEMVLRGDAAGALAELSSQYAEGADPLVVLQDLAEVTHWVSVIKITPEAAEDPTVAPEERNRGKDLAERLQMRVLTRMWQMLVAALDEVARAPNAMMSAEMTIIRLTHAADLPTPEELVRKLKDSPPPPPPPGASAPRGTVSSPSQGVAPRAAHSGSSASSPVALVADEPSALTRFARFESVLDLIRAKKDMLLEVEVQKYVRLVSYSPGRIEFTPTIDAPGNLAQKLGSQLQRWTGVRWAIIVSDGGTAATIDEAKDAADQRSKAEAREHPIVAAVFQAFPGAAITAITTPEELAARVAQDALPEVEDEWDPFEDN
ncbi:MAG: DNA polymerase III subunit gamma/tau, partial [Pseudomonadota bacterium]